MDKLFDIKKHDTGIYCLAKGINEHTFFSGSGDGTIGLWDINEKDVLPLSIQAEGAVFSLFYDSSRENLIIGKLNGDLHIIDLASKKEIHHIKHHKKGVFQIFELSSKELVTAGGSGNLSIWDRTSYQLKRSIPLSSRKLRCINRVGEKTIAVSGSDGQVQLLESELWNTIAKVQVSETGLTAMAKHPTKPVLFLGDNHGWFHIYKVTDNQLEFFHKLPAHEGAIYNIVFSPDKTFFATSSRDKSIKIWNAQNLELERKIANKIVAHRHSVNTLLWHTNSILISAGDDARVIAWEV